MSKWTKGPWEYEQSMRGDGTPLPEYVITGADVDVDGEHRVVGIAYRAVDAALMTSAPALVEALDSLCFEAELILKVGAYRDLLGRVNAEVLSAKVTAARAALSLAKGTQGETT